MQDLIIRDVRLTGARPEGNEVLEVDSRTPLDRPIGWVSYKAEAYKGDVRVQILCHGAGVPLYVRQRADVLWGPDKEWVFSQGGLGLIFCEEGVKLDNVHEFRLWRDKVKKIDIMGCGAAYITPGYEGRDGDGNLLCMRFAQWTKADVRASTAAQEYNFRRMQFGGWEGTVLTYDWTGKVSKVEYSPAN
jgi:hypothetical protein